MGIKEIPVFLVTGFLESGKTEFLRDTIIADYFRIEGKTLLFIAEEGIEEYDENELTFSNTIPFYVDEEEQLTTEYLAAMAELHKADRVIIEWNGMWDPAKLSFPAGWFLHQQIMLVNAETFGNFYKNGDMRSILTRLALKAEVIICNRCTEDMDLMSIKKELQSINSQAEIVLEGEDGEFDLPFTDDDLPYDVSGDQIDIPAEHYGVFFMDSGERTEVYEGKLVRYTGFVKKQRGMKKNELVFGRVALNGCVDPNCVDTSCEKVLLGYLARYKNAYSLKDGQWLTVTASMKREYVPEYGEEGPVLYIREVENAQPIPGYVTFG